MFARYIFKKRDQRDRETLEKHVTELNLLVKPCEYRDPKEMTRDKIVCGIKNPRIQEKLLAERNSLTLHRAVEVCKMYETTQAQLNTFDYNCHHSPIKQEEDVVYQKQPNQQTRDQDQKAQSATSAEESMARKAAVLPKG